MEPSVLTTQPTALAGHEQVTEGGAVPQMSAPCKNVNDQWLAVSRAQAKQREVQESKLTVAENADLLSVLHCAGIRGALQVMVGGTALM